MAPRPKPRPARAAAKPRGRTRSPIKDAQAESAKTTTKVARKTGAKVDSASRPKAAAASSARVKAERPKAAPAKKASASPSRPGKAPAKATKAAKTAKTAKTVNVETKVAKPRKGAKAATSRKAQAKPAKRTSATTKKKTATTARLAKPKAAPPYLAVELGTPVDPQGEPIGAGSPRAQSDRQLQEYALQLWRQMQRGSVTKRYMRSMERAGITLDEVWTVGLREVWTTSSTADEMRRYRQRMLFRANLLEAIMSETIADLHRLEGIEPRDGAPAEASLPSEPSAPQT